METIKINKIEYSIPQCLEEITFRQYLDIINTQKNIEGADRIYKIINLLTNIPLEIIEELDITIITAIIDKIKFINDNIKLEDFEPILRFTFKNEEYFVDSDVTKWNFRQFVDADMIEKNYQDNILEALPYFLAILSNKANEKYIDSSTTMDKGESFKELSLPIVFGIYSFFLQRNAEYTKISNHSLMVQAMVNQQVALTDHSIKNGDGIRPLKAYLIQTYWSKIKYSIKISTSYSSISVFLLIKLMLKEVKQSFFNKLTQVKNKLFK